MNTVPTSATDAARQAQVRAAFWEGYAAAVEDWNTATAPAQPGAPDCPTWCVVDHFRADEEYTRECATRAETIRSQTGRILEVRVVQLTDLVNGRVHPREIRIGNDTFTGEAAAAVHVAVEAAMGTLARLGGQEADDVLRRAGRL